MKNIRIFYLNNCHFLVVKFSVYLNSRVFIMTVSLELETEYQSLFTTYGGRKTSPCSSLQCSLYSLVLYDTETILEIFKTLKRVTNEV